MTTVVAEVVAPIITPPERAAVRVRKKPEVLEEPKALLLEVLGLPIRAEEEEVDTGIHRMAEMEVKAS